jgi:asparagine synthetase B (glutamine-hydrolysing)
MSISIKQAKEFRNIFTANIQNSLPKKPVGLAMSGGIDSVSVFFALIDLGVDFECYTFYQKGYESTDLKESLKYCDHYGIKINLIELSSDVDDIYKEIVDLIPFLGSKIKKTKVETMRPLKQLFENSKHDFILNGLSADDYQPYKRKTSILLKEYGEQGVINKGYRVSLDNLEDSMELLSKEMAQSFGIKFFDAYADKKIQDYFLKFTLKSLLTPHKNLVTLAYKDEFDKMGGFRKHESYQVNSKITDFHEQLLNSKYNKRNSKGVIAIYNDIKESLNINQKNLF